MQTKFWKLYTPSSLPPGVSCISPPTYYTSTRFGIPFGPFFNLASKNRNTSSATRADEDGKKIYSNDKMDVDQIIQNDIKSRISSATVTTQFDQSISTTSQSTDSSLLINLSQMMIPLQPRKNLVNSSPKNQSLENNSLRANLSEFKVYFFGLD